MAHINLFPRGSEWRKWDLHLHCPGTTLSDNYKVENGEDVLEKFCDELEKSDVQAFGITDYFSVASFKKFIGKFCSKYPHSTKQFFFNLELRLNETVNRNLEEVNLHLIFNPASLTHKEAFDKIDKFLSFLKVVKTGKDEIPIMCSDLRTEDDFKSATVTRAFINEAFENTYGKKANRKDHFLVFAAANNDGLRPERGKRRKEDICDEIDKFSDGFFGGAQNVGYYLQNDRLEDKELIALPKPVVAGSDSHSFEDLSQFLGKRVVDDKGIKQRIVKDITWIKADLTYEGLKQITYEPESGERVFIGALQPDKKEEYKVIRKIKFKDSKDFPQEIEFNPNLSAIIGSRSSGKSALLAYTAHAVDPSGIEKIMLGPGEGAKYHWNKITTEYTIEWANGKTNQESPGNVVYVSQSYLYEKSKDPAEVKQKIEPVLFKTLPAFEQQYKQAIAKVSGLNTEIEAYVDKWFSNSDEIKRLEEELKLLGDKKAIESLKSERESRINLLKESNQFGAEELQKYQEVSSKILSYSSRSEEIERELTVLNSVTEEAKFFTTAKITITPSLTNLPVKLQEAVRESLQNSESKILETENKRILAYKDAILNEKATIATEIETIKKENADLIEKHQKHYELSELIKSLNHYADVLSKISKLEDAIGQKRKELESVVTSIKVSMDSRKALISALVETIEKTDQTALTGLKFGLEYGLDNDTEYLAQKINRKERSDFVEYSILKFDEIRDKPEKFLTAVYTGAQRLISGNDKKAVVKEALQLTEKILFTAEMEGDRIGGFSEPTMTPGKRALFALRLILAESEDTWPLLIDQPEDDLDSRSIYDEVVPFLKEKKKERQIIMVSHNANLVIGADAEQVIVANRHGDDRKNGDGKQFNYLSGSLEFSKEFDKDAGDTLKAQGISEHACAILDGGKVAFEGRKNKYNIR